MRKSETLEEMVVRRNKRLKSLFSRNNVNVRLVGDDQKPAVIMDESVVLSCYVKNFDLHFTKEPFSDDIIEREEILPFILNYNLLILLKFRIT